MNKKVSRILLLLLALLSAVSIANATEQREAQRKTGLSFSGTTAYCYANCKSDNHEDKVTANVMLYQGVQCHCIMECSGYRKRHYF